MSSAASLYQSVIQDVMTNVRDAFLDEAIDESVLQVPEIKPTRSGISVRNRTRSADHRCDRFFLYLQLVARRRTSTTWHLFCQLILPTNKNELMSKMFPNEE